MASLRRRAYIPTSQEKPIITLHPTRSNACVIQEGASSPCDWQSQDDYYGSGKAYFVEQTSMRRCHAGRSGTRKRCSLLSVGIEWCFLGHAAPLYVLSLTIVKYNIRTSHCAERLSGRYFHYEVIMHSTLLTVLLRRHTDMTMSMGNVFHIVSIAYSSISCQT